MKKEVFLERLEALLQDIPEEEKRDAIDYSAIIWRRQDRRRKKRYLQNFRVRSILPR